MKAFFWVAINLIGFVILVFIYRNIDKTRDKKTFGQKLFACLQIMIMLYLIFDTALYLIDGVFFEAAKYLHYIFCMLYFMIIPFIGFSYFIYCDYRIYGDEVGLKRRLRYYIVPAALNALVVLSSPVTRMSFSIDEYNLYNRGDFFWIMLIATFGYILASYMLLAVEAGKRRGIAHKKLDGYLYVFPIPPFVLAVAQLLLLGPLLLGMGLVITVFFMYTSAIQSSEDKRRLSVRFRNIYIVQFAVVSFVMGLGILWALDNITSRVSQDFALYRASNTSGVLGIYISKEIGALGSSAYSNAVTEWLLDEDNPVKRRTAHEELYGTLRVLYQNNLYIVVGESGHEYLIKTGADIANIRPHSTISRDNPNDKWVFDLDAAPYEYNLNIDSGGETHEKKVWLNFKVAKDGQTIGFISTGMDFSAVAEQALSQYNDARARAIIIDEKGIVRMDSAFLGTDEFLFMGTGKTIFTEIHNPELISAVRTHLNKIDGYFKELNIEAGMVELHAGKYATIAPIGGTSWSVVTLFDSSPLFDMVKYLLPFVVIVFLFILFAFNSNRMIQSLIFTPLKFLVDSLFNIRENNGQTIYGIDRNDEIGILSKTIQDLFIKGNYDGLTGIRNRRFMEATMQQIMPALSRAESRLGVMMADVDFFKKYNDTYGHSQGDDCLKAIAQALNKSIMRSGDFVARYGGEEFVVVLPGTDENGVRIIAEKMLKAVQNLEMPHEKNPGGIVTISIGIATGSPKRSQCWNDYIKKADEALYMSKNNGRNQCTYLVMEEAG